MIWLIRLYLLLMGVIYFLIGAWAILDPLLGALETGIPSFLGIVGLSISSEIGYSEIAGLYGGINLGIGLMCFVGIFKKNIGMPDMTYGWAKLTCEYLANIAFEIGTVFSNAYLAELSSEERIGKVSGIAWGLGYIGGLLALVLALVFIVQTEQPILGFGTENGENIRATNLLVALWFLIEPTQVEVLFPPGFLS